MTIYPTGDKSPMTEDHHLSRHLNHYDVSVCTWVEPRSSVFLGECVTHKATVADLFSLSYMFRD